MFPLEARLGETMILEFSPYLLSIPELIISSLEPQTMNVREDLRLIWPSLLPLQIRKLTPREK